MANRADITQAVINRLPMHDLDLKQAIKSWYVNIRTAGGLRLTAQGYKAFQLAGINSWNIDVDYTKLTKKDVLAMDKKMRWPYFIDLRNRRLILFSSRDAVMASLYADIRTWIQSLS